MIKTDFPVNVAAAASSIETALAEMEPVQIYSIDFNVNSTTIKPDSAAVLKRIPGVPHNNSDWKLSMAGYADNIGQATANQQFSQRREKWRWPEMALRWRGCRPRVLALSSSI
jgi:outer membrane protein OmpA-like peptidoglycan-associated protein